MEARFVRHDVVDSTNERAFAALADGSARHGDVHVARAQTAGRGRLGRAWLGAPGEGLYLSAVLMPPAPAPPAPALTIAAGLATLDAVRALGLGPERGARLKWPNDVVVGDAKLAGILVETRGLDPARPAYVVGVGLNVAQRAFPPELVAERPVTSLALEGVEAAVERAAELVAAALLARTASFDAAALAVLERDYARAADLEPGRAVACATRAGDAAELAGTLVELTVVGGLAVRTADGAVRRVPLELVGAVTRVG